MRFEPAENTAITIRPDTNNVLEVHAVCDPVTGTYNIYPHNVHTEDEDPIPDIATIACVA